MKRRDLIKGMAVLPFAAGAAFGGEKQNKMTVIKPSRLKRGDTIALVAPSSGVSDQEYERAMQNFADLGLKVKVGKYVRAVNGFLAGTDEQRIEDLHWAFGLKEAAAVWCIRGGYGLTRILPRLDYELIRRNPKLVIGFSDITALLVAIHQRTGLVTVHGPVGTSNYTEYTRGNATAVLMDAAAPHKISSAPDNAAKGTLLYTTTVVAKGKARGRLVGGNLSLLTAMAGTPFGLKDVKGKILFLEDVGERPYRIDRMLVQLRQSVKLEDAAGIALGIFDRCDAPDDKSQTVVDVVRDQLGGLGVPVIYGLSFGHIRDLFTLPLGVEAELDTETATLTLLESAVV